MRMGAPRRWSGTGRGPTTRLRSRSGSASPWTGKRCGARRRQRRRRRWRYYDVHLRHMSATLFDLAHPLGVAHELGEANRRLAREAETPPSVVGLVEDIAEAISEGDEHELAIVNPWLWIRVQGAALRAQRWLREDDPQRRRQLRLALEQMRFLFARIAEREPIGEDQAANDVARWLESTLPSVSQQQKADLLRVGVRTYQRWISDRDTGAPTGADERRLRVVARIVNQLRHSLTGPGVIEWFDHPRADLDGASPADVLDDSDQLEPLLAAAAASRGNVAA